MKKLFLGLLSLSLLLGLTACGSGSSTTSSSPNANSSPSKAESAKASDSAKDPKETYDLTGKTLYLFCTSGSSGIEQSLSDLHALYPDLNLADGQRFAAAASDEEISSWIETHQ